MLIPVDTKNLTMIANAVERAMDWESREPAVDRATGAAVWVVHASVSVPGQARPEVWSVNVLGTEPKVTTPALVRFSSLVANTWEVEKKHGVKFRADSVEGTPINAAASNGASAKAGASA